MTSYVLRISDWSSAVCSSACLIAELFDAEALLGRAAGEPDGAATVDIRDLSGSRAHRACGGRDDDGFALLRLSDYREGGMSRRAVDPEDTEGGGQWQNGFGDLADDRRGRDHCIQIGRAAGRERVWQYGWNSGVAGTLKKKKI